MSKEQELGLEKNRRKIDIREEYFVRLPISSGCELLIYSSTHRSETQRSPNGRVGA